MYFYALDGDNVGRRLECLVLTNDCNAISQFSQVVQTALDEVVAELLGLQCNIVFRGGDSILACCDTAIAVEELPLERSGFTFSIGVGTTPTRALLALKQAKGNGKCRVEFFHGEPI